jgi:hypothetical protein
MPSGLPLCEKSMENGISICTPSRKLSDQHGMLIVEMARGDDQEQRSYYPLLLLCTDLTAVMLSIAQLVLWRHSGETYGRNLSFEGVRDWH